MKILVLISNYGHNQHEYCEKLINNILTFKKYLIDIKVFCSQDNLVYDGCEHIYVKDRFNDDFPNSIYDYLKVNDFSMYDYIFFTENDILYTEENFDTYFKHERELNDLSKTIGFLRYEIKDGLKYLVDSREDSYYTSVVETFGDDYVRYANCHQGSWFLRSEQLTNLINEIKIGNSLEDIASNYFYSETWPGTYSKFAIKKFIPINDYQNLLVHHQSNKYVDWPNVGNKRPIDDIWVKQFIITPP